MFWPSRCDVDIPDNGIRVTSLPTTDAFNVEDGFIDSKGIQGKTGANELEIPNFLLFVIF